MGKKRVAGQTAEELLKVSKEASQADGEGAPGKTKKVKSLQRAFLWIRFSYNNVLVTITEPNGNVIAWASSGKAGFKGPRKATPYAATRALEVLFENLGNMDIGELEVYIRGIGGGRDAALRSLIGRGLNITKIEDVTPIPHNGCRPRKSRRV